MTKNMTRKGLALGAAFALAGSAFVAIPAQAAGEITLAVTSGTGNGSVLGDSFSVKATLGSLVPSSSNDQIKFSVANAAEATLTATVDAGTAAGTDTLKTQVVGDAASTATTDASAAAAFVVYGGFVGTDANVYESNQTLDLATASAASHDVVVTAFLDADNDGVQDAGEFASAPVTINFVKESEVTWSVAFDAAPALADASIKATVSNDKGINIAQFAEGLEVGFATVAGTTYTTAGAPSVVSGPGVFTVGSAVGTDGKVTFTHAVAAGTYVAVVVNATDDAEISDEVLSVVGAATILDFNTEKVTTGANVKEVTATTAYTVRTGTSAITYTAQASKDNLGTEDAIAGLPVKVTITKVGMATGSSITAGGKTLAATGTSIDFTVTTAADGTVSVPVSLSGLADTNSFNIVLSAQGETGATTVVTVADTADASFAGLNLNGGVMKVAAGSTYSLSYAALDNFGQLLSGNYRVVLIESGATPDVAYAQPLVNGVATFSLTDSADVTESYSADLQVYNTTTGAWDDAGLAAVTDTPVVGSSNAAATVTLTGTGSNANVTALALNNSALSAADTRLGQTAPTVVTPAVSAAGNVATLAGQVTDAAGVATYSHVTLSAPGVLFVSGTVYSVGSITVQTSATGGFGNVLAYSNTAGKATITATAGAASKTLEVTFVAAALTTGATLTITAPDNVLPGSTLAISALLVDKWGNPVAATATEGFKYSYTGPGIQVGTAPVAYGTDGVAKLGYLLGSNDSGTITVTFSYDGDNDATTTADNLAVTKTITIGSAAVSSWTKNLNDGTVKMYAKNIVGAGKVQFMLNGEEIAWVRATSAADSKLRTANGASYLVRTVDLVEGQKNVLEIYVDGVRTTRTAYTY